MHLQQRHLQLKNLKLKNPKLKNQRLKNKRLMTSKRLKRQEKMLHNRIPPLMAPTLPKLFLRLRMPILKMMVPKRLLPTARQQKKLETRPRPTTGTQMLPPPRSLTWLKASEHKSEEFRQRRCKGWSR